MKLFTTALISQQHISSSNSLTVTPLLKQRKKDQLTEELLLYCEQTFQHFQNSNISKIPIKQNCKRDSSCDSQTLETWSAAVFWGGGRGVGEGVRSVPSNQLIPCYLFRQNKRVVLKKKKNANPKPNNPSFSKILCDFLCVFF